MLLSLILSEKERRERESSDDDDHDDNSSNEEGDEHGLELMNAAPAAVSAPKDVEALGLASAEVEGVASASPAAKGEGLESLEHGDGGESDGRNHESSRSIGDKLSRKRVAAGEATSSSVGVTCTRKRRRSSFKIDRDDDVDAATGATTGDAGSSASGTARSSSSRKLSTAESAGDDHSEEDEVGHSHVQCCATSWHHYRQSHTNMVYQYTVSYGSH